MNDEDTLKAMVYWRAVNAGVPPHKVMNLVESESNWNPKAYNKAGDYGLVQINLEITNAELKRIAERDGTPYVPITEEQAYDPVFSIDFAIEKIKEGKDYLWVSCNCYLLAKLKLSHDGIEIPRMRSIKANSKAHPGSLAIFFYSGNVKHVAYVLSVEERGFWISESNFEACSIGKRFVSWNDKFLVGFWSGL